MNIEEEGMVQGYVPEESRLRMLVVLQDEKGLHVSCLLPGENGGPMRKREEFFV